MSKSSGKLLSRAMAWVAVTTVAVQPQLLLAGQPVAAPQQPVPATVAPTSHDVALGAGGVLVGRIVDANGTAVPLTPIALRTADKEIARVHSDAEGNFRIAKLQGGTYELAAIGHQQVYRLWSPQTAPPAATTGLTVVARGDTIRGQFGPPTGNPLTRIGQFMAEHPIATAGLIGVAIAVPVAVAQDDDDPPATP